MSLRLTTSPGPGKLTKHTTETSEGVKTPASSFALSLWHIPRFTLLVEIFRSRFHCRKVQPRWIGVKAIYFTKSFSGLLGWQRPIYAYPNEFLASNRLVPSRLYSPNILPPNVTEAFQRRLGSFVSIDSLNDIAVFHTRTPSHVEKKNPRWKISVSTVGSDKSSDMSARPKPLRTFGFKNPAR